MSDEKPTTTRGIRSAQKGALAVLQHEPLYAAGSHVREAALEISSYHPPHGDQAARHMALANALASFLEAIVANTEPGPERSTAINHARTAKMFASAAIALEGC